MTHNSKEFEKVVDEAIYRHANPHLNGKEWDAKTTRKNLLEAHQAAIEAAEQWGYGRAANTYMLTGEAERIRTSNKALLEELKAEQSKHFTSWGGAQGNCVPEDIIDAKLAAIEKEEADGKN